MANFLYLSELVDSMEGGEKKGDDLSAPSSLKICSIRMKAFLKIAFKDLKIENRSNLFGQAKTHITQTCQQ